MLYSLFGGSKFYLKPLKNNLIDEVWKRKIRINTKKFYTLPNHSAGSHYKSKINKIVKILRKKNADYQFITSSENNSWLLNIRGSDSIYSPIPHSYILIDKNKKIRFFCDLKKISYNFKKKFCNVEFINIESTDKYLSKISQKKFIIDKNTCSLYFESIILKKNKILEFEDIVYDLKAIKNKTEIQNIKKIHIYDGVALTKYLFWVKKNYKKKKINKIILEKK